MANFGVKAGKLGAWFRATKEEITSGIIPSLWIAGTGVVLAICGFAIHRKLKSILANKDDAERQERERATNQAKEDAIFGLHFVEKWGVILTFFLSLNRPSL